LLKGQVGGDDQAGSFVGRADYTKEQFRSQLAGRHIAQFVEDQQVQLRQLQFHSGQQSFSPATISPSKLDRKLEIPAAS
jgi:hypothetical protein